MPRLIRRRPLRERVAAMLNPMDFLLWLSEEIETRDWDSKLVGTELGLACNFIFLLARANSGGSADAADPVFDEDGGSGFSGWLSVFMGTLVWILIGFSCVNAFYTLYRSRKYRLFEADVETKLGTPSARRVRVQSSPISSSPLRFLADIMTSESAESRAHPDRTRDVWEISVWDPLPISLQLFSLFGPGHVLVYMLYFPLAPLAPSPLITVCTCLTLQVLLSAQLLLFQSRFTQQSKDSSVIQKEVMHEYDTKFVHPRLYPTVRDVGTQFTRDDFGNDQEFVEAHTPTVQLRRRFETHPNPNYTKHIDPDSGGPSYVSSAMTKNSGLFTPTAASRQSTPTPFGSELRSRQSLARLPRKSTPGPTPLSQSTNQTVASTSTNTGNSAYLGVLNHPNSPLKKAPSLGDLQFRSPRNNSEMAQYEQYQSLQREHSASPFKSSRKSTGTSVKAQPRPWGRPQQPLERYPSMFQ
ncbi:hypothetical protein GGR56DRAFT_662996 [Xylariaceae sp. FL0804]|nr:hypothetical protein GGR56DRAFT_662996 [Xylariaceae sp. FL0804]